VRSIYKQGLGTNVFNVVNISNNWILAMTDTFNCPELPFSIGALDPILSKELVEAHYEKRTRGYYKKTNELVKGTIFERAKDLSELLTKDAIVKADSKLFNQAAQAWNHTFYWEGLCPIESPLEISMELSTQIDEDFSSFDVMQKQFVEKSVAQFGSGWAWLIYQDGKLKIKTTPNAQNPLRDDRTTPIFVVDIWEHSHELQYPADREEYVNQCFKILNWEIINQRFETAIR
jgi:Fe-Mn family superoxide dismutase